MICGTLTKFETFQMRQVTQLMFKKTPSYNQFVKEISELAKELISANKVQELVERIHNGEGVNLLQTYLEEVENDNWRKAVKEVFSLHHSPDFCLFNYPSYTGPDDQYKKEIDDDVFVFAAYAPAGRHQIFVKDPQTDSIYS